MIAANNLAWLYAVTGKGNLDEAVRLAQSAVQKNPNVPGFIDTLGWVYYKKKMTSLSIAALQNSFTRDSNNPLYAYHLGLAYAQNGDIKNARLMLEKALKLSPNFDGADNARHILSEMLS